MIRNLQINMAKPISIVNAGEALTRGMAVSYDPATHTVSAATAASGFGVLDVAPNYDGINAVFTPSDGAFENIAKGDLCFYISFYAGERIATNQIEASGLVAGDKLQATAGKFAKATGDAEWIYVGAYSDPTFDDMHIIQHA